MPDIKQKTVNILLVEDNPADIYLFSRSFSNSNLDNWQLKTAPMLNKAIEICQQHPIDLILLDLNLPDSNGSDTVVKFRESLPDIPLIVLTGCDNEKFALEALALGAQDYLFKEQSNTQFIWRAIRYALERAQVLKQLKESEQNLKELNQFLEEKVRERTLSLLNSNQELSLEITKRKQAENKYRSIFENAIEGIFRINIDGSLLDANPAIAKILGYESPKEAIATLTDIQNQLYVNPENYSRLVYLLEQSDKVLEFESQVYHRDGATIWISQNIRSVRDPRGELLYLEGTLEDITNRKQTEEKLFYSAAYDGLTNLPNRSLFKDRLQEALDRVRRNTDILFAVLFIDLDRFKLVNDSMGHLVGDRLLMKIAVRLQECIRKFDTVARLGGDEFAILLNDIESIDCAITIAQRIQKKLNLPIKLDEQDYVASASIGIVLCRDRATSLPYQNIDELMRDADLAMYEAKNSGKAGYKTFDSSMYTAIKGKLELETDLRWATERSELLLNYQPIICLREGKIESFEALLRWQHPKKGLISPNKFIPLAEETNLIVSIGDWVLQEACSTLKDWQDRNLIDCKIAISINVAGLQFAQPRFVNNIKKILLETGLSGENIHLEITESLIINDIESVANKLSELKKLGIKVCIDDFGTGYSSLSRLQDFPVDTLKIDSSFILQMCNSPKKPELVKAIVHLANSLDLNVVAEGVDRTEQLVNLKSMGCNYAQGYLFSRPVNSQQATELIGNPQWRL